jgi:hypothetical protein
MVQHYKTLQSTWKLSISLKQISEPSLKRDVLNKFQLSYEQLAVKDNYFL